MIDLMILVKNTSKTKLFGLLFMALNLVLNAQRTPASEQSSPIWISGATIHLGNGEVLNKGNILFENGRITHIGAKTIELPPDTRTIDAQGKHVYPGFIACNTTLGLLEIGAVQASVDKEEIGSNNSNIRAFIGYNAESKIVETTRPNGVLLAQVAPKGGRFSGTSSVMQLDAWNWEDALVSKDEGIHLNWPVFYSDSNDSNYQKRKKQYHENIRDIESYLTQAKNLDKQAEEALRMQPLMDIFNGKKKLYVHVNFARDILRVLGLKSKLGIPEVVIIGGYEASMVSDELLAANVPVITMRIHELPYFADDDIYHSPKSAAELVQKGVTVALDVEGDMPEIAVRNLPFHAGNLTAFGLDWEQALQTITLNPAKILGIDGDYGSLEIGKSATLFISEENALDMVGNQLTHAFIDGREIDLNTFQNELYRKYSKHQGVEIK